MDFTVIFIFIFTVLKLNGAKTAESSRRTFEIDYEHNQFLKDGSPFRYVSGSLHYFRVQNFHWRDRMRKIRAAGLNAISTYVEWSSHERRPGIYDFFGQNDLVAFLRMAQQEGLLVILRPGPYICAERDLGGYPVWILNKYPDIILRTSDSNHTKLVSTWFKELFSRIQPLLYGNGGPIITVQVENEYGSYTICDRNYTLWLRDLLRSYVGNNAVLFTTDHWEQHYLECGRIEGVFTTIDFGVVSNVSAMYDPLRDVQPRGPLVNSEFYTGRLTHWGDARFGTVPTDDVIKTLHQLLRLGVNFNFLMFAGGTNFGLTAGADLTPYKSIITSYDFDSPISEDGSRTKKYYAIKSLISQYLPVPNVTMNISHTHYYGKVSLNSSVSLWDWVGGAKLYGVFPHPRTMESLQLYGGMLLYETVLPTNFSGLGFFEAEVHDRAIVYLDKEPVAVLSREHGTYTFNISGKTGQTLSLLVENQGHINYENMTDFKGIVNNVKLNGSVLSGWNHTGFPLDIVPSLEWNTSEEPSVGIMPKLPAYFSGKFSLPKKMLDPHDTHVDMYGWGKGVVYVNGFSLGRYWPPAGPQVSLYLPSTHLTYGANTITVLETQSVPTNRTVVLRRRPILIKGEHQETDDDNNEEYQLINIVNLTLSSRNS